MKTVKRSPVVVLSALLSLLVIGPGPLFSQVDRFMPRQGGTPEVWRITQDPTSRDHANYHNTQCFSPDGRYICYTHYGPGGTERGGRNAAEVHLYDLHMKKDILIAEGDEPRWANNHNWLFYRRITRTGPDDQPVDEKSIEVMWLDVDKGITKRIGYGLQRLKETDYLDRWLYGYRGGRRDDMEAVRLPIHEDSRSEPILSHLGKIQLDWMQINPGHPVIIRRDYTYPDFNYSSPGTGDIPFPARHHTKFNLDGSNETSSLPVMEGSHFSWSGDGTYFLCGNGIMRGIRWDEFLPGNIHFLGAIRCGDICRASRSGRWICGSTESGRGPLALADIRSGDGWIVMRTFSVICFPGSEDNSGVYDIDAKGSPDGTKITFVSNYDLKNGPSAVITEDATLERIVVNSTDPFPEKGRLVAVTGFHREVLSYKRKTANSFEDLERGLYGTPVSSPLTGQAVTLFESRLIPEDEYKKLPPPSQRTLQLFKDENSPLLRQRSTDVYTVIVRKPDSPYLMILDGSIELIPGENHGEIVGYHILVNGTRITGAPLRPGQRFSVKAPGKYTAVAVEWSGLESAESNPLQVENSRILKVLLDRPADFTWNRDRWMVNGKEVSAEQAKKSGEALKEIVHVYDGVIHREWYEWGQIVKRHDLNVEGKATRRLFYQNGKLAKRELHNRDERHVSTEFFDPEGYITETIENSLVNGKWKEYSHWWYEKAVAVRAVKNGVEYQKDGNRWVMK